MAFLETPIFPDCVSLGALSKPRYKTTVIPVASGSKSRNIEWAQGLHSFDFSHNAMTQTQHDALLTFFHAIEGMGHQFRVHDPGDYQTTASNGVLIPIVDDVPLTTGGVGYGLGTFIAGKKYTAGALTTYRWLQKLTGSTVAYRNGSAITVGVGAGQISLDVNTGLITFVADQSRAISSHVVGLAHTLIPASTFSPNFIVGQRVWVSGVTGTAATLLNDQSHVIVSVSGPPNIQISLNTAGLTATGGTAYFYPQSTDALTLVTDFHVPCSFSSDEAAFDLFEKTGSDGFLYRWSGINLEEERIALT